MDKKDKNTEQLQNQVTNVRKRLLAEKVSCILVLIELNYLTSRVHSNWLHFDR